MYRTLFIDGKFELPDDAAGGYFHNDSLCRASVLHEDDVCLSDGLQGMNLCPFGGCVTPKGLSILVHLCHAILVSHHDVSIAEQDGIADFASFQLVVITPRNLSILDDEHTALLALSGIEEVMPSEARIDCILGKGAECQSYESE